MSRDRADQAHRDCWELLPWFVTARLSTQDSAAVEAHLRACAECREELQSQRELHDAVCRDDGVLLAPQAGLQKLLSRIDADEPHSTQEIPQRASPPADHAVRPPRAPRWLAAAVAVQGVCIAILLGMLWRDSYRTLHAPRYTTLSSPAPTSTRNEVIRTVFAPDTRIDDIAALLHSMNLQVVSGPSEAGVYTLAPSGSETSAAQVVQRMRGDPRVLFSELAVTQVQPR